MTDKAWAEGMALLASCLPDRELPAALVKIRGKAYRDVLNHMDDATWGWVVLEALKRERYFPAPALLLQLAEDAPPPPNAGLLTGPPCETCGGIGFEYIEREGREWARPCSTCRPAAAAGAA